MQTQTVRIGDADVELNISDTQPFKAELKKPTKVNGVRISFAVTNGSSANNSIERLTAAILKVATEQQNFRDNFSVVLLGWSFL